MIQFIHTNGLQYGNRIETGRGNITISDEELKILKNQIDNYFKNSK